MLNESDCASKILLVEEKERVSVTFVWSLRSEDVRGLSLIVIIKKAVDPNSKCKHLGSLFTADGGEYMDFSGLELTHTTS